MTYRIELKASAAKQIESFPASVQRRIVTKIESLAEQPRPHGVEKLEGEENAYRVRVGDYRILYQIHDQVLVVVVVRVGHRREVYR